MSVELERVHCLVMQKPDPNEWLTTSKLQWNLLVPVPIDDVTKPPAFSAQAIPDPSLPSCHMPAWLTVKPCFPSKAASDSASVGHLYPSSSTTPQSLGAFPARLTA
jgi:hypothetical protein